jgi:hypothetical protein
MRMIQRKAQIACFLQRTKISSSDFTTSVSCSHRSAPGICVAHSNICRSSSWEPTVTPEQSSRTINSLPYVRVAACRRHQPVKRGSKKLDDFHQYSPRSKSLAGGGRLRLQPMASVVRKIHVYRSSLCLPVVALDAGQVCLFLLPKRGTRIVP